MSLRPPGPVLVADLFPRERAGLLSLLDALSGDDWQRPTVCEGWSVKDLVAHLLADDLGRLSRDRDGHRDAGPAEGELLVDFIDRRNGAWVAAAHRLSPRVLCDALAWTGDQTATLFASRDPYAIGAPVSWAGPEPAPVWLDTARELTERWHHGEQIRDAVGAASADDPALLRPVLRTFAFALPVALSARIRADGTAVVLDVPNRGGDTWSVVRAAGTWRLHLGRSPRPAATVRIDTETAWRMYTRVIGPAEAASRASIDGDRELAASLLHAVAIIA